MTSLQRLVVFDARALRGLIVNDRRYFPDDLGAFRVAFQSRRFRILLTDGILREYEIESNNPPQFLLQPTLNKLQQQVRIIYFDENTLERSPTELSGLPKEHRVFILDSIAARAAFFITNRRIWLDLSEQTETRYGLRIVAPARFVELEG